MIKTVEFQAFHSVILSQYGSKGEMEDTEMRDDDINGFQRHQGNPKQTLYGAETYWQSKPKSSSSFHIPPFYCSSCSNFDPSLALKLAPVCQEALEAEHAGLLLVGQVQHCSSKTYVGLKFYPVAILVFW